MLVLTTAAMIVIGARSRHTVRGRLDDFLEAGFDETFLVGKNLGGHRLTGEGALDETSFTVRKMCQTFPAKRSFFYFEGYFFQRTDCLKLGRA